MIIADLTAALRDIANANKHLARELATVTKKLVEQTDAYDNLLVEYGELDEAKDASDAALREIAERLEEAQNQIRDLSSGHDEISQKLDAMKSWLDMLHESASADGGVALTIGEVAEAMAALRS